MGRLAAHVALVDPDLSGREELIGRHREGSPISLDGARERARGRVLESGSIGVGLTEPNGPAYGLLDGSRWSPSHARVDQKTNEFCLGRRLPRNRDHLLVHSRRLALRHSVRSQQRGAAPPIA